MKEEKPQTFLIILLIVAVTLSIVSSLISFMNATKVPTAPPSSTSGTVSVYVLPKPSSSEGEVSVIVLPKGG